MQVKFAMGSAHKVMVINLSGSRRGAKFLFTADGLEKNTTSTDLLRICATASPSQQL